MDQPARPPPRQEAATSSHGYSPEATSLLNLKRRVLGVNAFSAALTFTALTVEIVTARGEWHNYMWILLPMMLNRLVECAVICLKEYVCGWAGGIAVGMATVNLFLTLQGTHCQPYMFTCIPVAFAVCILCLEVILALTVVTWINWVRFTISTNHAVSAATVLSHSVQSYDDPAEPMAHASSRLQGAECLKPKPTKEIAYTTVVQPSNDSFAIAIAVRA